MQEKINFIKEALIELKGMDPLVDVLLTDELSKFKLDSLDIVELEMMYEDKTGKTTASPEKNVKTVQDLVDIMM